jgi:hypothetical protein
VKKKSDAPPPVLEGCRLVAYSLTPRLAIAEPMSEGELLLIQCDKNWRVLGASAHPSMRQARHRAERDHPDKPIAWVDAGVSKAQAEAHLDKQWKGERCSMCRRRPDQISQFFTKGNVRICDICIRESYALLGAGGDKD